MKMAEALIGEAGYSAEMARNIHLTVIGGDG